MLRKIHSFFGVGNIFEGDNKVSYIVRSLRDINNVIIPHFDKYPLITQKQADYLLFKQGINILNLKLHLSGNKGVEQILSIKASMNLGLPDALRIMYPTVLPTLRPVVSFK